MCIICSNGELGIEYLCEMQSAIISLKKCEKILLKLSDEDNIEFESSKEKASNYNKAHKFLVKIRKSLNDIERMRELKQLPDIQLLRSTCIDPKRYCGELISKNNE